MIIQNYGTQPAGTFYLLYQQIEFLSTSDCVDLFIAVWKYHGGGKENVRSRVFVRNPNESWVATLKELVNQEEWIIVDDHSARNQAARHVLVKQATDKRLIRQAFFYGMLSQIF